MFSLLIDEEKFFCCFCLNVFDCEKMLWDEDLNEEESW